MREAEEPEILFEARGSLAVVTLNRPKALNTLTWDMILTLQQFWAAQGCVVLQPYDMEVGAGTFHPATTLRSLGSKPWNAAYVQPSRRPKDGRYGETPTVCSITTSSR